MANKFTIGSVWIHTVRYSSFSTTFRVTGREPGKGLYRCYDVQVEILSTNNDQENGEGFSSTSAYAADCIPYGELTELIYGD